MPVEHHRKPPGVHLHPLRAGDLTASEVAAAFGLDPFKPPLQLYAEKIGAIQPQGDSPLMRRGRWLEPAVVAAICDLHPELRIKYPLDLYLRDPELRLGATPDAAVERDGKLVNVQCKVVSKPVFDVEWADGVPLYYQLQTATEAMLMNASASIVAALVITTFSAELQLFDLDRHAAAEAKIVAMAKTFWHNVSTGKRPPADFKRDADTLAAMFPNSQAEPVLDLSGDNRLADILPARAVLKGEISRMDEQVKAFDTEIKDKLGPHERATLPGWKISWKTQHIAERIVQASSRRPLLVTKETP